MIVTVFGIFLIAHGLVHAGLSAAPIPNDPEPKPGEFFTVPARSSLLSRIGMKANAIRWTGIILVGLSTLGFVFVGLGVLGVAGLDAIWRTVSVFSASVSLLLLVLFWHPWLVLGILIDIFVLISVLFLHWPSEMFNGG